MTKETISDLLLKWYRRNRREMPWRGIGDPYAVWVSEIMLQQTRVETVIPYYLRWMERFPDIASLAAAGEEEVLSAWEGLGYYSRARNLWQAARQLIAAGRHALPEDPDELQQLPGIGRYTAGAIASIAFGRTSPALDGNIKRVLSRLFDLELSIDSPAGTTRLWELAGQILPPKHAGDFNQALMDLGATVCLAGQPQCAACPLAEACLARQRGTQGLRPMRRERRAVPHYLVAAAVICRQGRVLIARRPSRGLLGGLWEFPGGKREEGESLEEALEREIREELGAKVAVGEALGEYRHAYTHFRVTLQAFACTLVAGEPRPLEASALAWVEPVKLGDYPMGAIDRRIARDLQRSGSCA